MKPLYSRLLAASISLLFLVSPALSKAQLSQLFLSGGKLPRPIEVTDPVLLRASNPWFGTFIPQWNQALHERIAGPPDTATRYEITFYATFAPDKPPHLIYVAYYAYDPATHRGFVYLPGSPRRGQDDPWHYPNAGTIIRPDQDGRWNLADPVWCDRINAILSRSEPQ